MTTHTEDVIADFKNGNRVCEHFATKFSDAVNHDIQNLYNNVEEITAELKALRKTIKWLTKIVSIQFNVDDDSDGNITVGD